MAALLCYCNPPIAETGDIANPQAAAAGSTILFNKGWEFVKTADTVVSPQLFSKTSQDTNDWQQVSLPHTAQLEPLVITGEQWQGNAFYRKFFTLPPSQQGKHIAILLEAAMHEADVYLNGAPISSHVGGYLPFEIILTDRLKWGEENVLLIRLNNEDNPHIPPGKPMKDLDFNYFSGLYRNAWLVVKDKLHIPDAVSANRTAGGGVLVHYTDVSKEAANVHVQTEVLNNYDVPKSAQLRLTLLDTAGRQVAQYLAAEQSVNQRDYGTFKQILAVQNPQLWSPKSPYLYTLAVEVLNGGQPVDREELKIGIRSIRFTADAFILNGEELKIRGTNRHQEYPYIGYALSDGARYRDAWKIKEAGFNFVRLSHYPQAPAFLRACDELGLLVMDAIPGWQFFGGEAFQANALQDIRDMVRRDRNHPSVILWEASLNESGMDRAFMEKAHAIVHEELPFPEVYTSGWLDEAFDVFIPARQHAKPPHYWNRYNKNKPLLIAEYGDWEYYAQNAGFNQKAFNDLKEEERTSRQLRGHGEKRLAQQALNYQEALNSNLQGKAVGDANWLMFDYNRGYAPDIEASGIMDIFRLPKFAYYFYKSQAGPEPDMRGFGGPIIFIANYWTTESPTEVVVYSNTEEVALYLNDQLVARQKPDRNAFSTHLPHPPFTFSVSAFVPGSLKAVGYLQGQKVVETVATTPAKPHAISLRYDRSGKDLEAGTNDVVFVYASVVDRAGTVVPEATNVIRFAVEAGDGKLIGLNPMPAEAGIATILLKAGKKEGDIRINATAPGLALASFSIPVSTEGKPKL
ncbi:glycoside hydrolase family 2 protein [Cesiribacter sp. SM1]|uniref:glycoside hydrolase family 2 protein n=1 Tax=Cesiribacter sp. SM1 TaxID=2861196 RepID=UPI001CD4BB7C|nr:glycoside hydrolase family 2 TIM barrel-domain containing protein [Cesiribacter sp. SM1]